MSGHLSTVHYLLVLTSRNSSAPVIPFSPAPARSRFSCKRPYISPTAKTYRTLIRSSDGKVKRSELVKLSTQLYRKKIFRFLKLVMLKNEQCLPKCCDSLQLLVSRLVLLLIPCFNLLYKNKAIVKVIHLCRCTATKIIQIYQT